MRAPQRDPGGDCWQAAPKSEQQISRDQDEQPSAQQDRRGVAIGQRASGVSPRRIAETTRSAASFAAKPRGDIALGARVFHEKFGYGTVTAQEGNKLEIEFETAGQKRVIDSFVKLA